ncbi:DUF4097 family beta strand repeat-containing protein [Helicobacter felis]|uniref:DUF4097 family beta strand repeat-containing protein n=1 Tax=Helicobacter felis TaxID=214 RepID=UPI000CF1A666|nr:DUF4097 family beta strand repeat-containing protein [Helicobacter felis]
MEKTFEFKSSDLEIKFGLRMEIEVLPTDKKDAFVVFTSDANEADLLIEHNDHRLYITTPKDEELLEEIKTIRSIGDAFSILVKKGLQGDREIGGKAKIYIPNNDTSLYLGSNRVKLIVGASMKQIELKLNACSVGVKSTVQTFKAHVNSGDLLFYEHLNTCQIKANNANIEAQAPIDNLDIDMNNGSVQLNTISVGTCHIKANNANLNAQAFIRNLDMDINKGSVNLTAHPDVQTWEVRSNKANITLRKNGVHVFLEGLSGSIGAGKFKFKTKGFVNVLD